MCVWGEGDRLESTRGEELKKRKEIIEVEGWRMVMMRKMCSHHGKWCEVSKFYLLSCDVLLTS
jgi:hypothetical protein